MITVCLCPYVLFCRCAAFKVLDEAGREKTVDDALAAKIKVINSRVF